MKIQGLPQCLLRSWWRGLRYAGRGADNRCEPLVTDRHDSRSEDRHPVAISSIILSGSLQC
jgi:hypothetical protein